MRESKLEKSLSAKVKKAGGLCYKFVSPNNPGVPDRIFIFPNGRIIFVELKTETGRLSKIQEWQINQLRAIGCDVRVLSGSADIEQFAKEVRADGVQASPVSGVCDGKDT